LHGVYGINKNSATPSWCLWACAITAALWLVIHLLCEGTPAAVFFKPLAFAGSNVLLAYLISEMLPSALELLHLDDWYAGLAAPSLACAIARSAGCAAIILILSALINRAGIRLVL
jgi:predicted acyltransferase